jgi:hypothetical protein
MKWFVVNVDVDRVDGKRVDKITTILTYGMWIHDNLIILKEAKITGGSLLTVRLAQIMDFFPRIRQQRLSAQYLSASYKNGLKRGENRGEL